MPSRKSNAWDLITMLWKPDVRLYPPYLRGRLSRGLGLGSGIDYQSYLTILDVPSDGTSFKIDGILVPRVFYMFSEYEAINFYLEERNPNVQDLCENLPILDLDWTLAACRKYGIRHGQDGPYPKPFTIDLVIRELIDGESRIRASSVKSPEDAADPEIRMRLNVERYWCLERPHIPWALVKTDQFRDKVTQEKVALNTLTFMRAWFLEHYIPNELREKRFLEAFWSRFERNVPLREITVPIARKLRVPEHIAMNIFRYCAWYGQIPVSILHPMAANLPLILEGRDASVFAAS
jgi:hypothetical protein